MNDQQFLSKNEKPVYVYRLPKDASQQETERALDELARNFDNVVTIPHDAAIEQLGGCQWEEHCGDFSIRLQAPTVDELLKLRQACDIRFGPADEPTVREP